MLIDLHAHSSGISKCCRIPIEQVIKEAKRVGIDGIVLTNHYQKNYVTDGDFPAFAARYIAEYEYAAELVKDSDFRIFFGIEVTMEKHPGVHMLIYGVEPAFLTAHPTLFDYTQEELYYLVCEVGGFLVQAHPMRRQNRLLDTRFLDGIEISCHPLYEGTHIDELTPIAEAADILLTAGGDFHADTHRARCGVYLDNNVKTAREFAECFLYTDEVKLCVQEVDSRESYDVTFCRSKA
ncbi:MAG: PHP domain-containing protein [Clostridia bacterium]|nr:PHP domain-containing protein [Clostridia bacterium]